MDFRHTSIEPASLEKYEALFRRCFPTAQHLTVPYLRWLYAENPGGLVVGFDAFDGDRLAAHYVCVPADIELFGQRIRALLSLNTATDPDYQGKGLFSKLAKLTYERGSSEGFQAVFGVANANSTPGFCGKLGFQLVCPLEARVGVGSLAVDWAKANAISQFRRAWTGDLLAWRTRNPANAIALEITKGGILRLRARTSHRMIQAYSEILSDVGATSAAAFGRSPFRLFLGRFPEGCGAFGAYWPIPKRFRPSPLNLIFRDLTGMGRMLVPERVTLTFADFDAY